MKPTAIALLIALAAWAFPLHVASAQTETKTEEVKELINEPPTELQSQEAPRKLVESKNTGNKGTNPANSYNGRHYSREEVIQLIKDYSAQYDINPEVPLCIAKYESGYNQFSKNRSSSASGLFQYLSSTWKRTDEGQEGLSVFDANANVRAAIKYMASRKSTRPWVVASRCPSL